MKTIAGCRSLCRATLVIALAYAGTAHAGGFQITEISGQYQGMRNAGAAARADAAATVYFNPAGMMRLPGNQFDASVHVIAPEFQFKNQDSSNAIGGEPVGDPNEDGGATGVVPTLFFSRAITDRFAAGLGINGPYGLLTEYDDDWIGRYNAVKSELITININPSLAYRINDHFSVGAGVNALWAEAELTNALDFGTLAFLGGVPGVQPSNPLFDGFQRLKGDDWGLGWNAGILFEADARTRFGIAYRSDIDVTLKGNARLRGNNLLAPFNPAFDDQRLNAEVDLTLPATLTLGAYRDVTDKLAVMIGAIWTNWSKFDEIRVQFEDPTRADSVQPENWRDSWRYALGLRYRLNDRWTLRAGAEFDDSPVRDEDRTPRIPDADRKWLVLGAGYRLSEAFSIDFAYTHIFVSDFDIDDTEVTTGAASGLPVGNTLNGEYQASADIFSLQVSWRF